MPTILTDLNDYLSRDAAGLADTQLQCPVCGRVHPTPFKVIRTAPGLVHELPELIQRILGRDPRQVGLVFDRAIEGMIEDKVRLPLQAAGVPLTLVPLGQPGELLDSEINLGNAAADALDPQVELLIGAGSGVICDLTKWIATRTHRPFITYGTAPSMNAYTSITATITQNDIKLSHWLDPAQAVLMDVDLQVNAPMDMIHAGMGDLAARAICNADWMLAHQIRGAYFCPVPYQMTAANEARFLAAAGGIRHRDPQAMQTLSEAVLVSGLSMTVLNGETSPSSGAEHVLSHFWDFLHHQRNLPKNLHGAQVGIGTLIMLAFYETMRDFDPRKIDPQTVLRRRPSLEALEEENNRLYGHSAPMFNKVVRKKYIPDSDYTAYLRGILDHWDATWQAVAPYAPALDSIRSPLRLAGAPLTLAGIQRTRAEGIEALVKGPQYRERYTLLDLAWELGILPGAAEEILTRAGVLDD